MVDPGLHLDLHAHVLVAELGAPVAPGEAAEAEQVAGTIERLADGWALPVRDDRVGIGDEREEVRVAAALQLAKRRDPRAVPVLQAGLRFDAASEACRLALLGMGVQPQAAGPAQGRFLVVRVKERGKPEALAIRLAAGLARAVGGYLSEAQLKEAQKKGIRIDQIMEQTLNAPKGTELFSLDDGKSTVTVAVE